VLPQMSMQGNPESDARKSVWPSGATVNCELRTLPPGVPYEHLPWLMPPDGLWPLPALTDQLRSSSHSPPAARFTPEPGVSTWEVDGARKKVTGNQFPVGPRVGWDRTYENDAVAVVERTLLRSALPPNSGLADEWTPAEIHHTAP
jgi:hypothetical protein